MDFSCFLVVSLSIIHSQTNKSRSLSLPNLSPSLSLSLVLSLSEASQCIPRGANLGQLLVVVALAADSWWFALLCVGFEASSVFRCMQIANN